MWEIDIEDYKKISLFDMLEFTAAMFGCNLYIQDFKGYAMYIILSLRIQGFSLCNNLYNNNKAIN